MRQWGGSSSYYPSRGRKPWWPEGRAAGVWDSRGRDDLRGKARDRGIAVRERVGFPQVRELVSVRAGVSVENAADRIVTGDVGVKALMIVAGFWGGGLQVWGWEVGPVDV